MLQEVSGEYERVDIMHFDEYRAICDLLDRFRKIGLQDSSSYEAAVHDPNTLFADLNGKKVPLYADVAHEKMYDAERCRELFDTDKVMLQCLPSGLPIDPVELTPGIGVLWEEFEPRGETQATSRPSYVGNEMSEVEFIHPDIPDAVHSRAWMASYSLDFSPSDPVPNVEHEPVNLRSALRQAWTERKSDRSLGDLPAEAANDTFMLFSEDVAARPDIVDELWRISGTGFGKVLGAHHPVAMEFNRAFFDEMIAADNSLTAVHYVDGKAVCFGFIGLDMDNNDWLNTSSSDIQSQIAAAKENGREYVHFYELISDGEKGMGYAMNVLDAFLDIAARTKRDFSVFFESTNLSSLYIPDIIRKKIQLLPAIKLDRDIEQIDRLYYRGAKVQ